MLPSFDVDKINVKPKKIIMSVVATKKSNGRMFPAIIEEMFNSNSLLGDFPSVFKGFEKDIFPKLPEANVVENESDYQIELAAPGFDRKDFNVKMENGVLNISAEKDQESNEKGKNFRRREFTSSSFTRSFYLPDNLTGDKVEAKYDQGILRVTLPKREMQKKEPAKQIKVL